MGDYRELRVVVTAISEENNLEAMLKAMYEEAEEVEVIE